MSNDLVRSNASALLDLQSITHSMLAQRHTLQFQSHALTGANLTPREAHNVVCLSADIEYSDTLHSGIITELAEGESGERRSTNRQLEVHHHSYQSNKQKGSKDYPEVRLNRDAPSLLFTGLPPFDLCSFFDSPVHRCSKQDPTKPDGEGRGNGEH